MTKFFCFAIVVGIVIRLALCYGVYTETGVWTTIVVFGVLLNDTLRWVKGEQKRAATEGSFDHLKSLIARAETKSKGA